MIPYKDVICFVLVLDTHDAIWIVNGSFDFLFTTNVAFIPYRDVMIPYKDVMIPYKDDMIPYKDVMIPYKDVMILYIGMLRYIKLL